MGASISFDGPRIYIEIALAVALVWFVVKALR